MLYVLQYQILAKTRLYEKTNIHTCILSECKLVFIFLKRQNYTNYTKELL